MNARPFIFNLLFFSISFILKWDNYPNPFLEKTGKSSIKLLLFQTLGFNGGNCTVNTFLFDQLIELISVHRY